MKKFASILLALLLLFVLASCNTDASAQLPLDTASPVPVATPEPEVALPNPIVSVESAIDFYDLGFIITPHQLADTAEYSIIAGKVAQIIFTLNRATFTYRGAVTQEDISGVFESFDPLPQSMLLVGPGFEVNVVVKTIGGGARGALAEWSYEDVRYTFYTPDSTDFDDITDVLLPIIYNDLPFAACCG